MAEFITIYSINPADIAPGDCAAGRSWGGGGSRHLAPLVASELLTCTPSRTLGSS